MTATDTTIPPAPDTIWCERFAALEARFPKVRDGILAAMNILTHDPNISMDDAKAQAAAHGMRITAASVNAAQKMLAAEQGATTPTVPATGVEAPPVVPRPVKRVRVADADLDPAALIQQALARVRQQGDAEAERLREVIRRTIGALQAAVES